ncbi:chitin synthase chs-2-like, partial [Diaphorina citri]|uniref:Chitin synthase chs-2-like n=1 Tax=Diaphorina citri TaxID=121845 RepID=A0A1S3DR05_DIACI
TRTVPETKAWDVFRDLPPRQDSGSMASKACLEFFIKALKVFVYLFTFIVVLLSGVVSKTAVFFMTSQLRAPDKHIPYCNKEFGRDKQFAVYLPIEERIAWFWCLIAAFIVPELGTAIRSIRICYFKSWKKPPLHDFIFVTSMELLHTLGLASLISRNTRGCTKGSERSEVYLKAMMDMIAVSAQATGALLWPLLEGHNDPWLWLIPPALFCVSCGYWENYTSKHSIFGFMKSAWRVKERLKRTRYFTYAFVSFLKILVFLCSALVFMSFRGESVTEYFSKFHDSFSQHKIRIYE